MSEITVYPTRFDGYMYGDVLAFRVEMFDPAAASVKIECCVNNSHEWDAISPKIRECLVAMKLDGYECTS